MRLSIDVLLDYGFYSPADLLLAIEVAMLPDQKLIENRLTTWGTAALVPIAGEDGIGRRTWSQGEFGIRAQYTATVELDRPLVALAPLAAEPLGMIPAGVISYLFASRYCDVESFSPWVRRRFGDLTGGAQVLAMADWIRREIAYVPGASDARTTAADTFLRREGVCRDYAHLLIAMARAAGIPARMVGCYAPGVAPPDFHAVVEVWLAGGWHLVDPSGLADPATIVRIGVGRDAIDISFLTVFGTAFFNEQRVTVVEAAAGG